MTQTRARRLIGVLVASLWMLGAGTYAYPGVKGEFEAQRRRTQAAQQHPPMIPTSCLDARGVERRDYVREDAHSDRCWVDLPSFRRLYPEITPHTDEDASAVIRGPSGGVTADEEVSPWSEVFQATGLVLGPPLLVLLLTLAFVPFATNTKKRTVARLAIESGASA